MGAGSQPSGVLTPPTSPKGVARPSRSPSSRRSVRSPRASRSKSPRQVDGVSVGPDVIVTPLTQRDRDRIRVRDARATADQKRRDRGSPGRASPSSKAAPKRSATPPAKRAALVPGPGLDESDGRQPLTPLAWDIDAGEKSGLKTPILPPEVTARPNASKSPSAGRRLKKKGDKGGGKGKVKKKGDGKGKGKPGGKAVRIIPVAKRRGQGKGQRVVMIPGKDARNGGGSQGGQV